MRAVSSGSGGWRGRAASRALLVAVVLATLLAGSGPARADEPSVAGAHHLLPDGATLGTATNVSGSTRSSGSGSGPCTSGDHPSGHPNAAIYVVDASVRSLLELTIFDDVDGASLCDVSLYAAADETGAFTDPFDAAQRSRFVVASTHACAASSSCSLRRWLDPAERLYVVAWAAPPAHGSGADAGFRYTARVRRPVRATTIVTGSRLWDACARRHEVITNRTYTAVASVTPSPVGSVSFRWERNDAGTWRTVGTYARQLSSGRSTFATRASYNSYWRVRALFAGNDTMLAAASAPVYVKVLTPRWVRYSNGGAKLYVPYHRQQRRLSCEAATLRMARNYFVPGSIDYDMSVYKVTGIDPRRPGVYNGCDPDRGFCGNVDGTMMGSGYGVHHAPIARASTWYTRGCRPAISLTGSSYTWSKIAGAVNNGFPVIVWGAHRGATGIYKRTWRAWTGRYITGYSVEHTWTVIGYYGPASAPTAFIVHDPSGGNSYSVSISSFWSFVKYYKTAVIVRG